MNDIRTLTLRFADDNTALRFIALAKSHGYAPSASFDGTWKVVSTTHQNKSERSKLIAAWSKESMEVEPHPLAERSRWHR